jgi:tetratricopeptide (TPR) repeat protein
MTEVMKLVAFGCPELETIAAYLDGRLGDRERARVTEHLASCEDCYTMLSESAQIHVAPETGAMRITRSWREWVTGARLAWSSAGAAVATAACLWLLIAPPERIMSLWQPDHRLQALVAAVGTDWPIEARLTGGFSYGPPRGVARSGDLPAVSVSPDVRIAAAQIEKEELGRRKPEALRVLGLAYLLTGDVGRAVNALEAAADHATPDALIVSDLAAAYIVRGARTNHLQDFTKALAAADRAVKADPALAEAWFNRAYALERLSLPEARDAWADYLKVDGQSEWADVARQHLRDLK